MHPDILLKLLAWKNEIVLIQDIQVLLKYFCSIDSYSTDVQRI